MASLQIVLIIHAWGHTLCAKLTVLHLECSTCTSTVNACAWWHGAAYSILLIVFMYSGKNPVYRNCSVFQYTVEPCYKEVGCNKTLF